MNAEQNGPPSPRDLVDEAAMALRSRSVPAGPDERALAETLRIVQLHRSNLALPTHHSDRERRQFVRNAGLALLATAAALLLGFFLSGIGGNTAAALDRAFERVRHTDSVRFRVLDSVREELNEAKRASDPVPDWLRETVRLAHSGPAARVSLSGGRIRAEEILGIGTTWIIDRDRKAALIVDQHRRIFQAIDMHRLEMIPLDLQSMNIRDELLSLKTQNARWIATEDVDGTAADKFFVAGGTAFDRQGEWAIWISRHSGLPVRVTVDFPVRGVIVSRVYDQFEWNFAADAMTFSLEPPEAFQARSILRDFPQEGSDAGN
jgi:hypothetical protein